MQVNGVVGVSRYDVGKSSLPMAACFARMEEARTGETIACSWGTLILDEAIDLVIEHSCPQALVVYV
jgi:hypothetical protein